MDDVITRVVEIERQCSADVEQAERESARNIEIRRRLLEEEAARERERIRNAENAGVAEAVEEAKKLSGAASAAARTESDRLFEDPVLREAIRKEILAILLAGPDA
ncbi:MAG: hypothetical protein PHG54_14390 [Smithellaceae bacterium]|nr:hypothetical protein [Syntrophaceae bacterium]MDD4242614.1 hypothetical protein [Smithellaceae bacterium]NLX50993.1 hypothetical protein [Deltaproteobacteria bacterium]